MEPNFILQSMENPNNFLAGMVAGIPITTNDNRRAKTFDSYDDAKAYRWQFMLQAGWQVVPEGTEPTDEFASKMEGLTN